MSLVLGHGPRWLDNRLLNPCICFVYLSLDFDSLGECRRNSAECLWFVQVRIEISTPLSFCQIVFEYFVAADLIVPYFGLYSIKILTVTYVRSLFYVLIANLFNGVKRATSSDVTGSHLNKAALPAQAPAATRPLVYQAGTHTF
jgi:hypothetical protein